MVVSERRKALGTKRNPESIGGFGVTLILP